MSVASLLWKTFCHAFGGSALRHAVLYVLVLYRCLVPGDSNVVLFGLVVIFNMSGHGVAYGCTKTHRTMLASCFLLALHSLGCSVAYLFAFLAAGLLLHYHSARTAHTLNSLVLQLSLRAAWRLPKSIHRGVKETTGHTWRLQCRSLLALLWP